MQSNGKYTAVFQVSETTRDTTNNKAELFANVTGINDIELVSLGSTTFTDFD
tara:strand:- start:185 stop:340 length:156 start_codon:yes stop_codon:yes gene_type:complete